MLRERPLHVTIEHTILATCPCGKSFEECWSGDDDPEYLECPECFKVLDWSAGGSND